MKLLRRGASSRRKTSDGLGGAGTVSPTRWRTTRVTSSPPRVVPATGSSARESRLLDYFRSRRGWTVTLGTTATLLLVVVIVLVLALKTSSASHADTSTLADPPPAPTYTTSPTVPTEPNTTLPGGYQLISKQQWGGRPTRPHPKNTPPLPLPHPTPFVVISATVTSTCLDFNDCSRICRRIQDDLMDRRKLKDISCNFLVGGDGNVYEGLGWDKTNARSGLNQLLTRHNVDICLIGDFRTDIPTDKQLIAAKELLTFGVNLGKLDSNYKLYALNDTTELFKAPGENVYTHIRHWKHFTRPNTV